MAISLSLAAVPAAAEGNRPITQSEEINKVVFVHYPQGNVAYWYPSKASVPTDESTRYKYTGIHWANAYAEYAVNPSGGPAGAGDAIAAAFDAWEDEPNSAMDFKRLADTDTSGSALDYENVVSWEDITTDYPGAIAVAVVWYYRRSKEIVEVDTIMNSVDPWSVNAEITSPDTQPGDDETYDVQNIMTHEAGHWLMLEDLYQWKTQKLTMYGYGALGELQKRTLGVGDELGIDRIY